MLESKVKMRPFFTGFMDGLALGPLWRFMAKADIRAAVEAEREACAQMCEAAANVMEEKTAECEGDADDIAHLRSTAWLMCVCANKIRTRSNAK